MIASAPVTHRATADGDSGVTASRCGCFVAITAPECAPIYLTLDQAHALVGEVITVANEILSHAPGGAS